MAAKATIAFDCGPPYETTASGKSDGTHVVQGQELPPLVPAHVRTREVQGVVPLDVHQPVPHEQPLDGGRRGVHHPRVAAAVPVPAVDDAAAVISNNYSLYNGYINLIN